MVNPEKQSALSDNMTSFHSQADLSAKTFGVGMKERLADRDMAWLSRKTGISTSTLSDIGRGKTPRTDNALKIAQALDTTIEELMGLAVKRSVIPLAVADIDDAEWENIPYFDFRDITDEGKGPAIYWTPFRKDWLNRTLGRWSELYLVHLLSGYESRDGASDLEAGDLVFCTEITPAELIDGNVCIFRREGALKVARYSVRRPDRDEGDVVMPEEISNEEFVPVCRILGRFAQRI